MFDVYYLIYGVKLSDHLIEQLIIHYIEINANDIQNHEFLLNIFDDDDSDEEVVENRKRKRRESTSKQLAEAIIEIDLIEEFFQQVLPRDTINTPTFIGDPAFIGETVWLIDPDLFKGEWDKSKMPDISDEKKQSIEENIKSIVSDLPVDVIKQFPKVSYYWIHGTS